MESLADQLRVRFGLQGLTDELRPQAAPGNFVFTLWDVGHGLAIWIQTPAGQNHWIDCGGSQDFSPSEHVRSKHKLCGIDYLIISHTDTDHVRDLPNLIKFLGKPRTLQRNKTLPDHEKYKGETLECHKVFKELDQTYTSEVPWETSPCNPQFNGGLDIHTFCNTYNPDLSSNDHSVVALYAYSGWLFICPGDMEDGGWNQLLSNRATSDKIAELVTLSKWRILVAPHHGRDSGYSATMMCSIKPHVVLVSDEYGQSPTSKQFREQPAGLNLKVAPAGVGRSMKYLTTKSSGRVQFSITSSGSYTLHQYEYWE